MRKPTEKPLVWQILLLTVLIIFIIILSAKFDFFAKGRALQDISAGTNNFYIYSQNISKHYQPA